MEPSPMLRPGLGRALGPDFVDRLAAATVQMNALQLDLPRLTGFHMMREIELEARPRMAALAELDQRLGPAPKDRSWTSWLATRGDGVQVGWATTIFTGELRDQPESAARFLLLDVHSRLAAWYVSHGWRATDLFFGGLEEMNAGRLLLSAAAARSLLEGVAAFIVEGDELMADWRDFKGAGAPGHAELLNFRARFNQALAQPQFGTRIGERQGLLHERLRRKNVLGLIDKFFKRYVREASAWETYDWLCDAVHPSYGSHVAYWRSEGPGPADAWAGVAMERSFGTDQPPSNPRQNEVAAATVSALSMCSTHLTTQAPRLRWFVHDFGLTTGTATASIVTDDWGQLPKPGRNDPCACGSRVAAKRCLHQWGSDREPPDFGAIDGSEP